MAVRPRFLLDEGVAVSVKRLLVSLGYEALTVQELGASGVADSQVARLAMLNHAVLVAHDGDMKQLAKRNGIHGRTFKQLNLLHLKCPEPQAPSRLSQVVSLMDHEWEWAAEKAGRRLHLVVGSQVITTHR